MLITRVVNYDDNVLSLDCWIHSLFLIIVTFDCHLQQSKELCIVASFHLFYVTRFWREREIEVGDLLSKSLEGQLMTRWRGLIPNLRN